MRVTVEFAPYNHRRYGKPWIAKVTEWDIGKQPVLQFGGLVGLTAEIEANEGAIIRYGQKDHRGNHTSSNWGVVATGGGSIEHITPEKARDILLSPSQR